jgi:hypothetical protein
LLPRSHAYLSEDTVSTRIEYVEWQLQQSGGAMNGKAAVITFMLLASGTALAQQSNKAAVYIQDNTEDNLGHRLAYAAKEQIRMSAGMRLTDTEDESGIQLHLVSIATNNMDTQAAYSIAITLINP